jgi:hypothetical protein
MRQRDRGSISRLRLGCAVVAVGMGAWLVAGCASAPPLKEEAASSSLAPMPRPERKVGDKMVNLRDGKEVINTLVEQTDTTQTWSDSLVKDGKLCTTYAELRGGAETCFVFYRTSPQEYVTFNVDGERS